MKNPRKEDLKYKIGDKVVFVREDYPCLSVGDLCTVKSYGGVFDYHITRDRDYRQDPVDEHEIKSAKIANTALSRALYPHYKVEGKYLIISSNNDNI